MDAAGKAAQAEARAKKLPAKKDQGTAEPASPVVAVKPVEAVKPECPKTFSLFDAPAAEPLSAEQVEEEEDILAEAAESQLADQDKDKLDEAA